MVTRYQVYGYYTDEPQVCVDVVDAATSEEAEDKVRAARGAHSGYTSDGAESIEEAIQNLQEILHKPASQIADDLAALAAEYADEA